MAGTKGRKAQSLEKGADMEERITPAAYYKERIAQAVQDINNTWRLEQIMKFINNITKED